jgi:hypothetical protein
MSDITLPFISASAINQNDVSKTTKTSTSSNSSSESKKEIITIPLHLHQNNIEHPTNSLNVIVKNIELHPSHVHLGYGN